MNLDDWLISSAHELADVARLADGTEEALDELLQRGLDWLGRIAPYDLAVIFELDGRELKPRAARGELLRSEVKRHHLDLQHFPSIRMAIEERRSRVFSAADHAHGEGDPFDGVMDFPHGHACMVVPLVSGSEIFGVMSLDRAECVPYPRSVVDLAEVFGRLLALSIQCVRLGQRLARLNLVSQARMEVLERRVQALSDEAGVLETSRCARVRELARQAQLVARTRSTVLLQGETGTGKERLARYIHNASGRSEKPFIPVNCAALPSGTLESELFGHEKGAFTGALRARPGLFRAADGGTLFLDEVGELPLELQGKLLRTLQEGEVLPVGAEKALKVDVRVVAASHVDLEKAVREGRFREDLFYRLSVFPLRLVPLRERLEDIPLLCEVLLQELGPRLGLQGLQLDVAALELLAELDYPGNIRELSNLLERGAIRASSRVIRVVDILPGSPIRSLRAATSLPEALPVGRPSPVAFSLAENERRYLEQLLETTGGRIYGEGGAAEVAGIPPTTLQSRMKKLGIRRTKAS